MFLQTLPPHLPRLPRALRQPLAQNHPSGAGSPSPFCRLLQDPSPGTVAPPVDWKRRALRETLAVSLLTALLTSAVLAAPDLFRQSPSTSFRQFSNTLLADGAAPAALLDCP